MNRVIKLLIVAWLLFAPPAGAGIAGIAAAANADSPVQVNSGKSITDRTIEWPTLDQWLRVVLLKDYNTRVVILGTTLLGCAAGMIGSFTLLRKRALMGDAISHATLPGIGLAFIALVYWESSDAKQLPYLLLGATATGLIGVLTILAIRNTTRLKEDTAMGAVLSVFFGAGIALLGVIQQMEGGHAAGLESFIYGKTASMSMNDTQLIGSVAIVCIAASLLLFKELKLLCFDEGFAGSRGLPVVWLDVVLMALVVIVCIVGLQAVGLILMIALLVIPAASARFWTETLWKMFCISGALGAIGGMVGAAASALFSKLPSGAMIVLVCTAFFLFSLVFGSARGVLLRFNRRRQLNQSVDRQHLLRAIYEILETTQRLPAQPTVDSALVGINDLLPKRSWSMRRLSRAIWRATVDGFVGANDSACRLTPMGLAEAARLTRQHRLWELYLISYADVAPALVDSGADAIEHVLEPQVIAELEAQLATVPKVPASPHELEDPRDSSGESQRPSSEHGGS